MLLDMKANADNPFLYGYTPLALAAEVSASWCIVLSGSDASFTTLLTGVMQSGHAEVVKVLLGAGVSADKPMPDGYTPLAAAAKVRHQETSSCWDASCSLTMLLSNVLQRGDADIVEVLLDKANTDKATPDGFTPLALAARVSAS